MAKVTIISGEINAGKTSALLKLSGALEKGTFDGFACVKRFSPNEVWKGYDLIRLSDHERIKALTFKDFYRDEFENSFVYGPFVFSSAMFEEAEKVYEKALEDPLITTLMMDEVGQVELNGMGYDRILKKILLSDKHLVMTIKSGLVEEVIRHYGITKNSLVKIIQTT